MRFMTNENITRKKDNGEPGNGGQFGHTTHDEAPGVGLSTPTPRHEQPVQMRFNFLRYADDYDDYGTSEKAEHVDVRAILDTMPLDEMPNADEQWDPSALEHAAIEAGLIDPDGCSVTAESWFNEDDGILEYAESRRQAGLNEPLATSVPLTPRKQHEVVGNELRRLHENLGVVNVLQRLGAGDAESVRADFKAASDGMGARIARGDINPGIFAEEDVKVLRDITIAAYTPDSNFAANATTAAAGLSDWLARRPGNA